MAMAMGMEFDPRVKSIDVPLLVRLVAQWRQLAPYYYGDYYPLTPYTTEDSAWVAWQFDRPATGDGMVQAFRRSESPFETVRFKLRGLDMAAQYSVSNIDAPGETHFSGRELEEQGLPVAIKEQASAVIITYKQVKGSQ
jgi:alpha-galactosidase